MIERNLIDKSQLAKALKIQQTTGRRFGSILVENGDITQEQLSEFLSFYFDVPNIDLTNTSIPNYVMALLAPDFISNAGVIPFKILQDSTGHKTLLMAMLDPTDNSAIQKVEELTLMEVEPFVITHGLFLETHKRLMNDAQPIDSFYKDLDTRDLLIALIETLQAKGTLSKEELNRLLGSNNCRD